LHIRQAGKHVCQRSVFWNCRAGTGSFS
jgi:hypothetical protein